MQRFGWGGGMRSLVRQRLCARKQQAQGRFVLKRAPLASSDEEGSAGVPLRVERLRVQAKQVVKSAPLACTGTPDCWPRNWCSSASAQQARSKGEAALLFAPTPKAQPVARLLTVGEEAPRAH